MSKTNCQPWVRGLNNFGFSLPNGGWERGGRDGGKSAESNGKLLNFLSIFIILCYNLVGEESSRAGEPHHAKNSYYRRPAGKYRFYRQQYSKAVRL
jgi:hypothetical protein